MIQPVAVSITMSSVNFRHSAASPRLRVRRFDAAVALGEPRVDLVLNVVDDPRPAPMIRGPEAVHAPFCER
jgi:hypothetical protein